MTPSCFFSPSPPFLHKAGFLSSTWSGSVWVLYDRFNAPIETLLIAKSLSEPHPLRSDRSAYSRRMLSRLVVLLLLAQGARADDCECTPLSQPPPAYNASQWPQFYIQNAIDNSGSPCSPKGPCVYTMDSGDPNKGIGNFKILNWDQDDNTNSITILGNDSGIFNVPTAVTGMTFDNKKNTPFQSLSQEVQVVVTIGAKPVNILCTLERTALGTTPAPLGTTPAPTAPPTGTDSISNDVIFMVDAGFNSGSDGNLFNATIFAGAKALAIKIVNKFTNVNTDPADKAPATGSRLGVSILSQIASGSFTQPWLENASTVAYQLNGLTQVYAKTEYVTSIQKLVPQDGAGNSPFNIKNDDAHKAQNSRTQAQRLLIVVASTVPSDISNMNNNTLQFLPLDVHPIFIGYGFSLTQKGNVNQTLIDGGWTVYFADDNSDATVSDFVDNYLLNAAKVCPFDTTTVASETLNFQYPTNYQGASSTMAKWNNKGQTARYCNFHKKVQKTITATNVQCYKVFYDLEVEKDFLRFFDSSNQEIASFTGSDISGSTFSVNGNVTLQFDTNESQVFGGFQISFTPCQQN